jgi:hypothetical protein
MKRTVRDDIIKLESYVDAEFKYKKYIEILNDCGGYCFLEQFVNHFEDDGGYYLKRKMEESKLIQTKYFSNFKFIKLSSNSSKYLYYRDDEKDYSNVEKNKISASFIPNKPTDKVLYTSAMYFELYHKTKKDFYLKSKHREMLDNHFKEKIYKRIDKLKEEVKNRKNAIKYYSSVEHEYMDSVKNFSTGVYNDLIDIKNKLKNYIEQEKKNTGWVGVNPTKKAKKVIEKLEDIEKHINFVSIDSKNIYEISEDFESEIDEFNAYIKKSQEEIKELEKDISGYDEIIDKIISIRDISKLIITIENNTLHIYSNYVRFAKRTYFQIVYDLLKKFDENNKNSNFPTKIENINFHFCSIFNSEKMLKKVRVSILSLFSKKTNYNLKINFDYMELPELKKYGEVDTGDKDYLKEKHKDAYEEIYDTLNKKTATDPEEFFNFLEP